MDIVEETYNFLKLILVEINCNRLYHGEFIYRGNWVFSELSTNKYIMDDSLEDLMNQLYLKCLKHVYTVCLSSGELTMSSHKIKQHNN